MPHRQPRRAERTVWPRPQECRTSCGPSSALALPDDGNRYEVLDGELFVAPSPAWGHQSVVEEMGARLRAYCGCASTRLDSAGPRRHRLLAVEVLSPGTARADRHRKREICPSEGVPEYWIIDGDARLVERWRPLDERPEIASGELVWQPRADPPPFRLVLEEFFSDAAS